jgi:hypothetical protein
LWSAFSFAAWARAPARASSGFGVVGVPEGVALACFLAVGLADSSADAVAVGVAASVGVGVCAGLGCGAVLGFGAGVVRVGDGFALDELGAGELDGVGNATGSACAGSATAHWHSAAHAAASAVIAARRPVLPTGDSFARGHHQDRQIGRGLEPGHARRLRQDVRAAAKRA